jgi:hypothetical protein
MNNVLRRRQRESRASAFAGNLLATSILLPGAAGFLAVVLYLVGDSRGPGIKWFFNRDGTRSYLWATITAIVSWLVFALLTLHRGYARRASAIEYNDLQSRYATLRARLEGRKECLDPGARCDYAPALREVEAHLDYVGELLSPTGEAPDPAGLRWVAGTGYLDLRERLHRAEEALLELETLAALEGAAVYDDSRIEGSRIGNSRQLLKRLEEIRAALGQSPVPPGTATELREVRETINEYRERLRRALVQSRNQLFAAAIYASANAYALLGVAMIAGATRSQILAAAVYFLIGATVGLFKQLHSAWSVRERGGEDYGLDTVRLIQTPLFSGLAAVGGVVLTLMLLAATPSPSNPPTSRTSSSTTPTAATGATGPTGASGAGATGPTGAAGGTGTNSSQSGEPEARADKVPSLSEIFDLDRNPITLVIAAVFGLTPALLISRLSAQSERYKAELKSSERTQDTTSG